MPWPHTLSVNSVCYGSHKSVFFRFNSNCCIQQSFGIINFQHFAQNAFLAHHYWADSYNLGVSYQRQSSTHTPWEHGWFVLTLSVLFYISQCELQVKKAYIQKWALLFILSDPGLLSLSISYHSLCFSVFKYWLKKMAGKRNKCDFCLKLFLLSDKILSGNNDNDSNHWLCTCIILYAESYIHFCFPFKSQ